MKKNNIWIPEEEKITFFSHYIRKGLGGGGIKALADMSAKNVSFFGRLPLSLLVIGLC